jgi:NADH-quinone oxidoreductase subunit L
MIGDGNSLAGAMLVLVPVIPLLAAVLGYVLALTRGKGAVRLNAWLGSLALAASAVVAAWLILQLGEGQYAIQYARPWLTMLDGMELPLAFHSGHAQLLFALTTALIGFVVLVFAARERRDDPRAAVFFATLTLFAGSMLLFLIADTLLIIYIAWELMGVCSYLLIAHPATKEAWRAARQAFWATRATDFGLLFAVIILMTRYGGLGWGTFSAIDVNDMLVQAQQVGSLDDEKAWLGAVALLVLAAVLGKAAQFPLSFWLADAMVAPAPVSALLHAATMVAAGPFLLIRFYGFLRASEAALLAATLLGALTLFVGAAMALCAEDPKRVLAYSTVSHLGLVILAVGVLSEEAGYFHLQAHAWFKAALFLGVGYLVAVQASQRHRATLASMAGSARRHPLVLWGILVPAGLSLAGLYPLAGALGKEQVLAGLLTRYRSEPMAGVVLGEQYPLAAAGWHIAAVLVILSLPLTAAYIVRLVGILGWGKPASEPAQPADNDDSTQAAQRGWGLPLVLTSALAVMGSIVLAVWYFTWYATPAGFKPSAAEWKWAAEGSPLLAVCAGLGWLAFIVAGWLTWHLRVARPAAGDRVFREGGLANITAFFRNGMYLRELFQLIIGGLGGFIAMLAGRADTGVIDWLAEHGGVLGRALATLARWVDDHVVDGLRYRACEVWWLLKRLHSRAMQTGHIQHYMFVVLVSTMLLCLVVAHALGRILADILGRV